MSVFFLGGDWEQVACDSSPLWKDRTQNPQNQKTKPLKFPPLPNACTKVSRSVPRTLSVRGPRLRMSHSHLTRQPPITPTSVPPRAEPPPHLTSNPHHLLITRANRATSLFMSSYPDYPDSDRVKRERSRSPRRRSSRSPRRSRRSYSPRSRSRSRDDYRPRDRRSRSPLSASGAAGPSGSPYGGRSGYAPRFEDRTVAKENMMQSVRDSSQQDRRVYVGNLSYDVKWHHLKDFMRQGEFERWIGR